MKISIVPWRTPEQFKKVYDYAYCEDLTKMRWAVEQIEVWETRCWPSLPYAVEATLLFVRAKIQDILFEADKSFCQAREVEMMYSTAVVRFVNLMLENDQNAVARIRMSYLAEKHNIPDWIIDMRHNISHGFSPNLPILRMAYKTSMECLASKFWSIEAAQIAFMQKTLDKKPMVELIQKYRKLQLQTVHKTFKKYTKHSKAIDKVCLDIDSLLSKPVTARNFLEVLVHPDYFVVKEDIAVATIEDKDFLDDEKPMQLPNSLKKFWCPLFRIIHKYDYLHIFMELLLLSQENRKIKAFQKVADCVILDLFADNSLAGCDVQSIFHKKGIRFDLHRLLYACLKGSSTYANKVFEKISPRLKMDNWENEFFAMLSIKQGLALVKEAKNDSKLVNKGQKRNFDITFTVGDLDEDIHLELRTKNPRLIQNHWSMPPVTNDFSKLPLGYVLNPVEKQKIELIQEIESKPVKKEHMMPTGIHDNIPIAKEELKHFIFKKLERKPGSMCMIYQRRNKKQESE